MPTLELGGGSGGMESTGCLPRLALVTFSFMGDISQEDEVQPLGMGK